MRRASSLVSRWLPLAGCLVALGSVAHKTPGKAQMFRIAIPSRSFLIGT
jgi:hypothetical protein